MYNTTESLWYNDVCTRTIHLEVGSTSTAFSYNTNNGQAKQPALREEDALNWESSVKCSFEQRSLMRNSRRGLFASYCLLSGVDGHV